MTPLFRFFTQTLPVFAAAAMAQEAPPPTSVEAVRTQVPAFAAFKPSLGVAMVQHPDRLANFRLRLEYRLPETPSRLTLQWAPQQRLPLTGSTGAWHALDARFEHLPGQPTLFRASIDGGTLPEVTLPATAETMATPGAGKLRLDGDFTLMLSFSSEGDGSLLSQCRTEKWAPDAKMIGLRGGRLFYDIGWLGVVNGRTEGLADGRPHVAVVRTRAGKATLFVDGRRDGEKAAHTRPDAEGHSIHVGLGAKGFVGDLKNGAVAGVRYWERALSDNEAVQASSGKIDAVNTPLLSWASESPVTTFPVGIAGLPTQIALLSEAGAEIRSAWVQPLADVDHAAVIGRWSEESLAEGAKIYQSLCVTCHGTPTQEGSMPTSRRFHRDAFKNGADPFRQFQTLTRGYGLMVPMPQYTAEQKYAVIHYIRETFLTAHNRPQLTAIDAAYLDALPVGMRTLPKARPVDDLSHQYERMDFGPALSWTYQISPDNLAYKGVAVRLDDGPGGVSKGHAWAVYDHDTMRLAAGTTGSFIDWKGVAFDGSHNSHSSLTGDAVFTNPVGPGWANPATGSWHDPRMTGRDGKPYGPLPRDWMRYRGQYFHGRDVVLSYDIGKTAVLDATEAIDYGPRPVFIRTLNVGPSDRPLRVRLAAAKPGLIVRMLDSETAKLTTVGEFHIAEIAPRSAPIAFRVGLAAGHDAPTVDALLKSARLPADLASLTRGGPARWTQVVKTAGIAGSDDGPFATDVLTHPESGANPWQSWLRLTGFDFFADGKRAAVCTWLGDVWIVDGIDREPLGELTWRRIATGLFQPLGLKILNETVYVTCRDQIARLQDLNGDGETDFVECFNNDQQVTEHFHEFAMGLQADAAGNLYYAKSARHALPALVPQHGTLLRVSADGSHTDILATGFRAANGVCLNPDGTFFVTDQEGHWTPKNRINLVRGNGPSEFFGNMMGYHDITDASDSAMQQPLCWITNAFDRSPSELLWVPKTAKWGSLNGSLLNLSYGYGKIYTVPFEKTGDQPQGGMCALPMPQFPTGVMRGRFHPTNGQFYGCGMFAWAGNQSQPGGFYRVRRTDKPALQPIGLHFEKARIRVDFSDALDAATATEANRYAVKAWSLKRSANYGSPHVNERPWEVTKAEIDGEKSLWLTVPTLEPTMCLEISCRLREAGGTETERTIHGTIHRLEPSAAGR